MGPKCEISLRNNHLIRNKIVFSKNPLLISPYSSLILTTPILLKITTKDPLS